MRLFSFGRLGYPGGSENAFFGYDGAYQPGGRNVERRVAHLACFRGDEYFIDAKHFLCGTLFDDDAVTVGRMNVYGGCRRRNVKRDAVMFCKYGKRICTYLIGRIAVCRYAVCAYYDGVYVTGFHKVTGHVVRYKFIRDTLLHQLPGGQPRALKVRPCFVHKHVLYFTLFKSGTYNSKRGAVARRRKRARVTMRNYNRILFKQPCAVVAYGAV